MGLLFISCDEAARRISRAQDVPLARAERLGLRLHLAVCQVCRRYLRQIRFLRPVLRELPAHLDEASTERLSEPAKDRIISHLRDKS